MDSQSHQNSSDQRTQKFEDRSKNVLVDEHKHKSVAETGSETSGRRNDLSRQLLARHNNMLKANSEDPVAIEENIERVQHNNVYNLRNETNVAQPLSRRKNNYQSVAQFYESGVFTAKTKPPRYSGSNSRKNQSKSAHASQRRSKRRGYLEPLQESGISDFSGISHDHKVLLRAANLARDAIYLACSSSFWKKVEPIFASVREEDTSYLLKELELSEALHGTQPRIPRSEENILDTVTSTSADQYHDADYSSSGITLIKIAFSALISEDDIKEIEDDEEFDYRNLEDVDEIRVRKTQDDFSGVEYEKINPNDKFLLELHSIDLYSESSSSKEIDNEIVQLQQSLHQQIGSKKTYLKKIYELIRRSQDAAKQSLEQVALDKLVQVTYQKLLHNGAGKCSTQALLRRVLARCHEFQQGGASCFDSPPLLDTLLSAPRADSKAEFVTKSSANRPLRRSLRQRQTKAEGPSQDSISGEYQKNRKFRRNASTSNVAEDKVKEIIDNTDLSLPDIEGTDNADKFLDLENADLGSGNDDFSFGLDIPMDDLSTVDMSIP